MARKVLGSDPFTLLANRRSPLPSAEAPRKKNQRAEPKRKGRVRFAAAAGRPVSPSPVASLEHRLSRQLERMDGDVERSLDGLEDRLSRALSVTDLTERVDRLDTEIRSLLGKAEEGLSGLEHIPGLSEDQKKQVGLVRGFVHGFGELIDGLSPSRLRGRLARYSMRNRSIEVDEFGLDRVFEARLAPFLRFLYETYWRVETIGISNVPNHGRALLVANHAGLLPYDGLMIKHAVSTEHPAGREVRFLVEDFIYHFPFFASFLSKAGGARACRENAERLLLADEIACVFPEGMKGPTKPYRERYQLQRFGRGGFITLCMRTNTPLIPVAVVGSEEIHPVVARMDWIGRPFGLSATPITPTLPLLGPLGLVPLPSKWHIHFGEPIDLSQYGDRAVGDNILVSRLKEDVRSIIQEMIKENLKQRRSPLLG